MEAPPISGETPSDHKKKGKKELGMERVRLALERLQLAWIRSSMTMIALGFTAYRFFYSRLEEGKAPLLKFVNGRHIGLFLLFMGFIGLLQATFQHIKTYDKLRSYYPELRYSVALIQSYLVLALGIILFAFAFFEL